jgi:hypothetical protein
MLLKMLTQNFPKPDNLSKLITILLDEGLDDVVRVVTTDKVAREEYYKKYNIK